MQSSKIKYEILHKYESYEDLRSRGYKWIFNIVREFIFSECTGEIFSSHDFEDRLKVGFFPITVYRCLTIIKENDSPTPQVFNPYRIENPPNGDRILPVYLGFKWYYVRLSNDKLLYFNCWQEWWNLIKRWFNDLEDSVDSPGEPYSDYPLEIDLIFDNGFKINIPAFDWGNIKYNAPGYTISQFIRNKWILVNDSYVYQNLKMPFIFSSDGCYERTIFKKVHYSEKLFSERLKSKFKLNPYKPIPEPIFIEKVLNILNYKIELNEKQQRIA